MCMVLVYSLYILLMIFNQRLDRWAHDAQRKIRTKVFPAQELHQNQQQQQQANESTPLHLRRPKNLSNGSIAIAVMQPQSPPLAQPDSISDLGSSRSSLDSPEESNGVARHATIVDDGVSVGNGNAAAMDEGDGDEFRYPWQTPETAGGVRGCLEWSWWLLLFPAHVLFFLTIPDVRKGPW